MLSRSEQKALYDSIIGDLIINTNPDGSGNDITIPISVHWGFEPVESELPSITIRFITIDNPTERTLGDFWSDGNEGEFTGYLAESSLLVKIKAVNYGSKFANNFIEKTDIVEALTVRVFDKALLNWDSLIDNGSVVLGGISAISDITQIFEEYAIKEYQFTIRIQKLTGGIPIEEGVKFSTAPTLLSVESTVEFV